MANLWLVCISHYQVEGCNKSDQWFYMWLTLRVLNGEFIYVTFSWSDMHSVQYLPLEHVLRSISLEQNTALWYLLKLVIPKYIMNSKWFSCNHTLMISILIISQDVFLYWWYFHWQTTNNCKLHQGRLQSRSRVFPRLIEDIDQIQQHLKAERTWYYKI